MRELEIVPFVHFPGVVPDAVLLGYYRSHDFYVSSNHLQTWGLAAFEAVATGLPVIISHTAGASEVLTHKKNAMIVEACSPEAIAAAVKECIDNPELYKKLNEEGRKFVEANITWEKTANELIKIFESIKV